MDPRNFARLAAVIFAIIAVLQLARAAMGWSVSFQGMAIPVWPSWIAFVVAGGLAWLGFTASK
jgi:hypothetical protein